MKKELVLFVMVYVTCAVFAGELPPDDAAVMRVDS